MVLGAFATAWALTAVFLRSRLAARLLDYPGTRSSHSVATPRGGGVGMVIATLVALLVLGLADRLDWSVVLGLGGGGAIAAATGFRDDYLSLPARWRLLGHFVAAGWLLAWLSGPPQLMVAGRTLEPEWLANVLALFYVVWMLNLTNFMDGIDGIAGIEAITVSLSAALLAFVTASGPTVWVPPLVVAAATSGFLVWNWPPAKVFLGDSGSGFLGLVLAGLSLLAGWTAPALFWSWIILLGVFTTDATFTLACRVVRGDRFYEGHRSHAYQNAAHLWRGHRPVTLAVGAINVGWLLPIAALVATERLGSGVGVLVAYVPLILGCALLGAGRPHSSAQIR